MTKFAAQISRTDCKDEMCKWLYLLKNIAQMSEQDNTQESSIFRKFYETCQLSKLTTMEKEEYTKSVLEYEDVQDALNYMRKTSLKEGFEKGLAEGKAEGIAEGEAKGKAEGEAKAIYLAKKAEADGLRALKEAGVNEAVLELKRFEALAKLSEGKASKIIIPTDAIEMTKKNVLFSEVTGLGDHTDPAPDDPVVLPTDDCCDGIPFRE